MGIQEPELWFIKCIWPLVSVSTDSTSMHATHLDQNSRVCVWQGGGEYICLNTQTSFFVAAPLTRYNNFSQCLHWMGHSEQLKDNLL